MRTYSTMAMVLLGTVGEKSEQGMPDEVSAGLVVLRQEEGEPMAALAIRRGGGLELPKGHLEATETPLQAAMRELTEETGWLETSTLEVLGSDEPLLTQRYSFTRKGSGLISKTVHYFTARATSPVTAATFG
jgi:8-oxo-dGTP pyrophosphatase MutT (NUDIX family)